MGKGSTSHPAGESIEIIIECRSREGRLHFEVSPKLSVALFLDQVLDTLAKGENGAQVQAMREYYQPVLEHICGRTAVPLDSRISLAEAGIENGALCRIAAEPRKERIMFCNSA